MSLVPVRTFRDPVDAHLQRVALEAADIPAFVADEHVVGVQWLYSTAIGGVKLLVDSEHVEAARRVLAVDSSFELAQVPESEIAPTGGDTCPSCGSTVVRTSPVFRRSLAVSLLAGLPLFFWRKRWLCPSCGHSWRRERASSPPPTGETLAAEEFVHGERGPHTVLIVLLLTWLGGLLVWYVLRQPTAVW
jgi:hypothetical protein